MASTAKLTRLPAGHSPCHQDYPLAALCLPNGSVAIERTRMTAAWQRRAWAAGLRALARQLEDEARGRPADIAAVTVEPAQGGPGEAEPAEAAAGA
jgi:adenosylmethionine-8-amino-7-oxononanoate aminotransferase